jgi:hypothetical protein
MSLLLTLACTKSPLTLAWEEGVADIYDAALSDDGVFYVTEGSTLRAIDAATGGTTWTEALLSVAGGMPVIDETGDVVVWTEAGALAYSDAGELVWSRSAEMVVQGPPAVGSDDTLYFPGITLAQDAAMVTAMSGDQEISWQHSFAQQATITTQPALSNTGVLYVALSDSGGGLLVAMDADDGSELWSALLPGPPNSNTRLVPQGDSVTVLLGDEGMAEAAEGGLGAFEAGDDRLRSGPVSVTLTDEDVLIRGLLEEDLELLDIDCGPGALDAEGQLYASCVLPDDPGRTLVVDTKGRELIGEPADYAADDTLPGPFLVDGLVIWQIGAGFRAWQGAGEPDAEAWWRGRGDGRNTNREK